MVIIKRSVVDTTFFPATAGDPNWYQENTVENEEIVDGDEAITDTEDEEGN